MVIPKISEVIQVNRAKTKLYQQYVPFMWSIANIKDIKLWKMMLAWMNDFKIVDGCQEITKFHCFFSHLLAASRDNKFQENLLTYIDGSIKHLYECVGDDIQRKITNKVKEALLDISDHNVTKVSNPAYLNTLAELLYVDNAIRKLPQEYVLTQMDASLGNGKDADYYFHREDDNADIYFDVLNIHGIDLRKIKSSDDLYQFIRNRIQEKIKDKTKNLSNIDIDYYEIKGIKSEFYVVPIVWSEACTLVPYANAFESLERIGVSGMVFSLMSQRQRPSGDYAFSMETMANIISRWKEDNL